MILIQACSDAEIGTNLAESFDYPTQTEKSLSPKPEKKIPSSKASSQIKEKGRLDISNKVESYMIDRPLFSTI